MQGVNQGINIFVFLEVVSCQSLHLLVDSKPFSTHVQLQGGKEIVILEKLITMEFVVSQKLLPVVHFVQLVLVCQLF